MNFRFSQSFSLRELNHTKRSAFLGVVEKSCSRPPRLLDSILSYFPPCFYRFPPLIEWSASISRQLGFTLPVNRTTPLLRISTFLFFLRRTLGCFLRTEPPFNGGLRRHTASFLDLCLVIVPDLFFVFYQPEGFGTPRPFKYPPLKPLLKEGLLISILSPTSFPIAIFLKSGVPVMVSLTLLS